MKVFMSWSGTRSHEVAKLLGDWLQDVIQAVKPWISSAGIDRGELWFRKISDNLGEVNQGIVCLTPENKENPWIMFEAGALLKGLPEARVMTFLIDLKHQDVREPLSQFNHTTASKADMFALVTTLNSRLGEAALVEARLTSVFNTFWPQFEEKYAAIMTAHKPEGQAVERPQGEILTEVLETVRGLKKQLSHMETGGMENLIWARAARPGMVDLDHFVPKAALTRGDPSKALAYDVAIRMHNNGANLLAIENSLISQGFSPKVIKEILSTIERLDRVGGNVDLPPDTDKS